VGANPDLEEPGKFKPPLRANNSELRGFLEEKSFLVKALKGSV